MEGLLGADGCWGGGLLIKKVDVHCAEHICETGKHEHVFYLHCFIIPDYNLQCAVFLIWIILKSDGSVSTFGINEKGL